MSDTTSLSTPKYRRYKEEKTRRVFTVIHESRHLIVENVSKPLRLSSELFNAFAVHGDIERSLLLLLFLLLALSSRLQDTVAHLSSVMCDSHSVLEPEEGKDDELLESHRISFHNIDDAR